MALMGAGGGQGDDVLSQVDAAIAGQIQQPQKKRRADGSEQPNLFEGLIHDVRDLIFGRNPNDPVNQAAAPAPQSTPVTPLQTPKSAPLQKAEGAPAVDLNNKGVEGAISGDAATKQADSSGNFLKMIGKFLGL